MNEIKIVCLGDSITFGYNVVDGLVTQAKDNYPAYLEKKLSNQYEKIEVINSGKPGWQVKQAEQHLEELVLKHQPDICFIMYGINDMRGSARGGIPVNNQYYFNKLNKMILKMQLKGIEVVVLTPICIENEKVTKLSQQLLEFGQQKNIQVIDVNKYTRLKIAASNQNIKEVIGDSVHFIDEWYSVIADIILEQYFGMRNEK